MTVFSSSLQRTGTMIAAKIKYFSNRLGPPNQIFWRSFLMVLKLMDAMIMKKLLKLVYGMHSKNANLGSYLKLF